MRLAAWQKKYERDYPMKQINVNLSGKTVLVTGAAGFIGSNLVKKLLATVPGVHILGIDNCNDYYDVSLKEYRLEEIRKLADIHAESRWTFLKAFWLFPTMGYYFCCYEYLCPSFYLNTYFYFSCYLSVALLDHRVTVCLNL